MKPTVQLLSSAGNIQVWWSSSNRLINESALRRGKGIPMIFFGPMQSRFNAAPMSRYSFQAKGADHRSSSLYHPPACYGVDDTGGRFRRGIWTALIDYQNDKPAFRGYQLRKVPQCPGLSKTINFPLRKNKSNAEKLNVYLYYLYCVPR